MAKSDANNIAEISSKIFSLLEPLESADRLRVFHGTMMLLGEPLTTGMLPPAQSDIPKGGLKANDTPTVKQFFDGKDPNSKVEELAVAARYRELQRLIPPLCYSDLYHQRTVLLSV